MSFDLYRKLTHRLVVRPTSDDIASAMFKNARLKLLMTLVGFQRLGFEDALDTTWIVPSAFTSSELGETLSIIEKFEHSPWVSDDPNESPEDLLRRKRHTPSDEDEDVQRDAFIDDSEGDDGPEDFMFPDNIRSKSSANKALDQLKEAHRKQKKSEQEPLDDEVAEARRNAKKAAALERRRKIKSQLYIHDSDEDMNEEESRKFFAREEEGRKRQAERVKRALTLGIHDGAGKSKKRKSAGESNAVEKRRKQVDSEDDGLLSDEDGSMIEEDSDLSPQHVDTSDEAMEDTPLSSQSHHDELEKTIATGEILKELRQPPAEARPTSKVNPEAADEDDEEVPVASSRRARYRAGFIIDSDDDDE
jgi:replication fork protection complex subunit Tof1/Swi1